MIVSQGGYIVNLANHNDGTNGTHWVAIWVEGRDSIYHDPFGVSSPESIVNFLANTRMVSTKKQIQNELSGICGYYVLMFLYFMNNERKQIPNPIMRAKEYLENYSSNPEHNRKILECLLKQLK
jgi:hypothetical protein